MRRLVLGSFVLGWLAGGGSAQTPCYAPAVDGPTPAGCRLVELEADYLHWWVRSPRVNTPLLTAGDPADPLPGVIGQPGTRVLVGNGEHVALGGQPGFRAGATFWLGDGSPLGVNLGGFFLGRASAGQGFASDAAGNPLLGQSVVLPDGTQSTFLVSDPRAGQVLTGTYQNAYTSRLFGYEANLVYDLARDADGLSVRGLAGFRQIGLRESFRETVTVNDPGNAVLTFGGLPTTGIATRDEFRAETDFYGVQVGTRVGYQSGPLGVDLTAKVALGVSQQRVTISGLTTNADGQQLPGGLRALTSNNGRDAASDFAVAPEVGLNVSYELSRNVSIRGGYSFLYLSRVVRPLDQIDPVVNPGLVPSDAGFGGGGEARPRFERQPSDFWAHGLNVGLVVTW